MDDFTERTSDLLNSSELLPLAAVAPALVVVPVVVVTLVPSSALKPMVCSVDAPLAVTASFELLGFWPAPAREPPCEPFFCTFDLFLFGDAERMDAELMEQQTNGFCGFVLCEYSCKKICR